MTSQLNNEGVVGSPYPTTPYKVPKVGLEPTRACAHWILSPARLPFRHSGLHFSYVDFAL